AKQIIASQKRRDGRDLVFGRGENKFSGWMNCKKRVNDRITAATGQTLDDWRPHDFRRTFSTLAGGGLDERRLEKLTGSDRELAAGLGIAPHTVEAILNQRFGPQVRRCRHL